MQKKKPLDELIAFLKKQPKWAVGKKLAPKDAAAVLALAKKNDARVHELMTQLVTKPASFCVFDIEMYGEYLLRGKRGDLAAKAIGSSDVCIARNGAGDPYVWNAETGEVRMLVHDEDWAESGHWDDVDTWVEAMMEQIVESASVDQVDKATKAYLACLRFAVEMAGEDALDDEVREKLG